MLLVLAADTSDRVPGVNFLPGWQAVIPRSLHIEYVNAKHSDLMNEHNVQSVVDAIMSRLISKTDEKSLSVGFDTRTTLMQ